MIGRRRNKESHMRHRAKNQIPIQHEHQKLNCIISHLILIA